MGGFSVWHILIVAVVAAFLFFGWKQLPDMARSMGRSLRVFKTEIKGMTEDDAARETARDADRDAQAAPKQLAPRPTPVRQAPVRQAPQAEVVRNAAAAAVPAGTRPRPAPRPGNRAD